MAEHNGTWWIWKVFWILLIVTTVEVALGIIKPEFMLTQVAGTSILNYVFIILTIFKAAYICLLYTSPSPRDGLLSRMPSSA